MPFCVNMEQCLTNGANKQRLINMFICALHCAVYEQFGKASDDADGLLVPTSLQIADTYATVMIAEYTDLLVLLLYKAHSREIAMMFISYRTNQRQQYSEMPRRHRSVFVSQTFFSHMLMGQCDTTARRSMYDISKNVPLKRIYLPMTRSCRTRGTSGA